jgi:hypothetical protein
MKETYIVGKTQFIKVTFGESVVPTDYWYKHNLSHKFKNYLSGTEIYLSPATPSKKVIDRLCNALINLVNPWITEQKKSSTFR